VRSPTPTHTPSAESTPWGGAFRLMLGNHLIAIRLVDVLASRVLNDSWKDLYKSCGIALP
jgi:hypothetical protein